MNRSSGSVHEGGGGWSLATSMVTSMTSWSAPMTLPTAAAKSPPHSSNQTMRREAKRSPVPTKIPVRFWNMNRWRVAVPAPFLVLARAIKCVSSSLHGIPEVTTTLDTPISWIASTAERQSASLSILRPDNSPSSKQLGVSTSASGTITSL
ncbi:hypothetical protein PMAYCL1PPCAC_24508 [Pristionchus mayeri]|uniref:Uncharacterized protein n=1 Tax=Pristionchus mayeri TaxID=1317129 RepID=A0AAN5I6L2_9BILA|nr:hypothetical protein PMAYCL1PPCAC_24508 [Pristionchus mayeri]